MIYLIQILLPVADPEGRPFGEEPYRHLKRLLLECFGGATASTRGIAKGFRKDESRTIEDDIIVIEVMTQTFDRSFWQKLKRHLKSTFRQEEIVIRLAEITLL